MKKKQLRQFIRYINKVYHFQGIVKRIRDHRQWCKVTAQQVFLGTFFMFGLRLPSFNQLEQEFKKPEMKKLIPSQEGHISSADTLGYALNQFDINKLEEELARINKKLKRNKVYYRTPMGGKLVVAIDGVELWSSRSRCCEKCLTRQVTLEIQGQKVQVTEYYHRAVICQLVGVNPPLILGIEMIEPGEGELTAAMRLFPKVMKQHDRYFHIMVVDALYAKAPFINLVIDSGVHIVVRLKDERMEIVKDSQGLFTHCSPDAEIEEEEGKVHYRIWDEEEFTSWKGVKQPLRVVKLIKEEKRQVWRGKQKEEAVERHQILCATTLAKEVNSETSPIGEDSATTLPKIKVSGREIGQIYHWRWGVENNGIRDLKTNWHMAHAFVHKPHAMRALLLILAIVFNLFYAFIYRNLKSFRLYGLSIIQIVREFWESYFTIRRPLYWLYWDTS